LRSNTIYRPNLKRILFIAFAFLLGQFSASTHAHELHTETDSAPDHQICSLCLTATESESDSDLDISDEDKDPIDIFYKLTFDIPVDIVNTQSVREARYRSPPHHRPRHEPFLLSQAPPLKHLNNLASFVA